MSNLKTKKEYKRKSVISQIIIILIGIFIFLLIVFFLVKAKIISNNNVLDDNQSSQNYDDLEEKIDINNTVNVISYVFNSNNQESDFGGYFTNLTDSIKKQKYVSLVLEEDKLLLYDGITLNKFMVSVYDGETLETFTGTYEKDEGNFVLKFLSSYYNNYDIPNDIKIYIDENYAILDGNKLIKDDKIASVYSNDDLSSLVSIFGKNTIKFSSILFVKDDLSKFGVANQNKFMITGYNENAWDFYFGDSYEKDSNINLKMRGYGFNTINDVMPKEVTVNMNNSGIIIDNILLKQ